jgi:hypothetical protein
MAKINVEVGVYLPSNPDGKVVDIDKKSGRPLQSHAKVSERNYGMCTVISTNSTGTVHGDFQSEKGSCRNRHRS